MTVDMPGDLLAADIQIQYDSVTHVLPHRTILHHLDHYQEIPRVYIINSDIKPAVIHDTGESLLP